MASRTKERRRSQVYEHYPQVKEGTVPDGLAEQVPSSCDVTSLASLSKVSFERDQARAASSYAVGHMSAQHVTSPPGATAPYTQQFLADPGESKDHELVFDGISGYQRHRYEAPVAWISKSEVHWLEGREHSASAMRRHSACSDSFIRRKGKPSPSASPA